MRKSISIIFIILCHTIYAQEIKMITNANGPRLGSNPNHPIVCGENLYYSADDGLHGNELFVYDGVSLPHIVADITEGRLGSYFLDCFATSKFLFFELFRNNSEYWMCDQVHPPFNIKDRFHLSLSNESYRLKVLNDKFYFYAYDSLNSPDLWVIDSSGLPMRVKDINKGFIGHDLKPLVYFKGNVYFIANGNEIWVNSSDNSLKKLSNCNFSYIFSSAIEVNNNLYFSAWDAKYKNQVWRFDGINSPVIISDTTVKTGYKLEFFEFNNKIYYHYKGESTQLSEIDGNQLTKNIFPGLNYPFGFNIIDNQLVFLTKDYGKIYLRKYDGINPPLLVASFDGNYCSSIKKLGNHLYFSIYDVIWKYNGSDSLIRLPGSAKVSMSDDPTDYIDRYNEIEYKGKLYITESPYWFDNANLWQFEGNAIPNIVNGINNSEKGSSPSNFIKLKDKLYFSARNEINSKRELFEYNGFDLPTKAPNATMSSFNWKQLVDDSFFTFITNCGRSYCYLSSYNGENTKGIGTDELTSAFIKYNGKLYFGTNDSYNNWSKKLLIYDRDSGNVEAPGTGSVNFQSIPENLVVFKDRLYFTAKDSLNIIMLWTYDGASVPVEICSLKSPSNFYVFGDKLYFSEVGELWVYSEGEKVSLVSTICSGDGCSVISQFKSIKDHLFFTVIDNVHGKELWKLDGENAAVITSDIYPGKQGSDPGLYTEFKGYLYFTASDSIHGKELWRCNGINPPELVFDIKNGSQGSDIKELSVFDNKLFFAADDGLHGDELWYFDGINQPKLFVDLYSGIDGSNVNNLVPFKNKLCFSASIPIEGTEIFEYCPHGSIIDTSICDSLFFNSKYIKVPGTYYKSISISEGIDSIITLNLTLKNSSTSSIDTTTCKYYTSPNGKILTISGEYKDTIPNTAGCDSILTINLTINRDTKSAIQPITCNNYTSPSGKYIWKDSGTYLDTIPNACGCDSIITVELNLQHIDPTVSLILDGYEIVSNDTLAHHQWVDCDEDFKPIAGQTGQSFKPIQLGNYAVVVSYGWCSETSECVQVNTTGIVPNPAESGISVYPNPTNGKFTIDLGREYEEAVITIRELDGRVLLKKLIMNSQTTELEISSVVGMYLVNITTEDEKIVFRIITN